MQPDFTRLLLSARRCNAAYVIDPAEAAKAFAALGSTFIAQYRNDNHQAVLSHDEFGIITLTISGTRVQEGSFSEHVGDLYEDIDWFPTDIGAGCLVAKGACDGLGKMWAWVFQNLPGWLTAPMDVEGHSLGGWRTTYTPLFISKDHIRRLTRFEPPKAGNDAFYAKCTDGLDMTTVVHELDPWFAFPWHAKHSWLNQHAGQKLLWLTGGTWKIITEDEWPGVSIIEAVTHQADHGPDTVIDALAKLASVAG